MIQYYLGMWVFTGLLFSKNNCFGERKRSSLLEKRLMQVAYQLTHDVDDTDDGDVDDRRSFSKSLLVSPPLKNNFANFLKNIYPPQKLIFFHTTRGEREREAEISTLELSSKMSSKVSYEHRKFV